MSDYHFYRAKDKQHNAIISVLAQNEDEARQRVTEELKKPGRTGYLARWQADGEMIDLIPDEQDAKQSVDPFADDFDDSDWKYT